MSDNTKNSDNIRKDITFNASDQYSEVLNALADTQRRRIILYLQEEGPASQNEIAQQLVTWKHGRPYDEVSDTAIERVKIELHHKHLPQLEDAGLIEYDRRSKTLLVSHLPELAESCVDHTVSADIPS